MKYCSTRGQVKGYTFEQAVEAGLADDGGLFVPEQLPDLSQIHLTWGKLKYADLAAAFFSQFAPEIKASEWSHLCQQAYQGFDDSEVAPLVQLDEQTYVLELWHGPTLAFKDFALQLLGLLYKRQVQQKGRRLAILGATSGDTGSAAIHGCLGQDGINIFILYPEGRVAPLQERQMACTEANNVYVIPIPGFFDDAQALVKECFADKAFVNEVNLSAVNSINIARILAQCVYYLYAYLKLPVEIRQQTEFIVPTGNFGNVLAGWLLKKMGVPLFHFTVATNQNDILHRFFQTGEYAQGSVKPSLAPSMDIQAASNFERFLYYWKKENPAEVLSILHAIKNKTSSQLDKPEDVFISSTCTDDVEIQQWIKKIEEQYQYIVDPHTACGFNQSPCHPAAKARVILSTAHPAKFPEVIHQVLGIDVVHPSLECLKSKELTTYPLSANVEAVKTLMRQKLALL